MMKLIKSIRRGNHLQNEIEYLNSVHDFSEPHINYAAYFHDQKGNLGDRIIPRLAIDLLRSHYNESFLTKYYQIRNKQNPDALIYDAKDIKNTKAVIIGAGGLITGSRKWKSKRYQLFLNFSSDDAKFLADSDVPSFFWTTGVNRWSNKHPFSDNIKTELTEIFSNITHAYLRGSEDIDFLKSFLPTHLHKKLSFQPCASYFLDELRSLKTIPTKNSKKRIAINIASDHLAEFFQVKSKWKGVQDKYYKSFALQFNTILKTIDDLNLHPIFFCNTVDDSKLVSKYFANYDRIDSFNASSNVIAPEELYCHFDFCLGMRLHSWLPFLGLEIPSLFISPFEIRSQMPIDLEILDQNEKYIFRPENLDELKLKIENLVINKNLHIHAIKKSKTKFRQRSKDNATHLLNQISF